MPVHPSIWPKLACPICLGSLVTESDWLRCSCGASYPIVEDVPIVLLEDEHAQIKKDEIAGEVEFNQRVVPLKVHEQRNKFVDQNTEEVLRALRINLAGKQTLIVGCSMTEMLLCCRLGATPVGLDIVPRHTIGCAIASKTQYALDIGWICGDGEHLPFRDGSFDVVLVRQTLHHMVKYRAALAEFLRVTRDLVLIIDEPFMPGSYDSEQDVHREYQAGNVRDPERMLADKYHDFTLTACLKALKGAGAAYTLYWARENCWADETGPTVRFCHGRNLNRDLPMPERLVAGGQISIAVHKRLRTGLRPMTRDTVMAMLT
jgi:ubiquinone/menaquinone biosynthesis C-methylase UbiE/uncharacterized protein YbaR (Trm112 family)